MPKGALLPSPCTELRQPPNHAQMGLLLFQIEGECAIEWSPHHHPLRPRYSLNHVYIPFLVQYHQSIRPEDPASRRRRPQPLSIIAQRPWKPG